jgi:hypothetical protein
MRTVVLAVVLALAAGGNSAAAQATQAPPVKQMPKATVTKPGSALMRTTPNTGAGRYEVSGVDIHIQGAGELPGYRPSTQNLNADSPNDSVIVVRGTVHGAGVLAPNGKEPTQVFHVQFKNWDVFPGLPATCSIKVASYQQDNKYKTTYIAYFGIRDTATKAECWKYFVSLKTFEPEILFVKTYSDQAIPKQPITDGGKRTLTLGPLLPKTPE